MLLAMNDKSQIITALVLTYNEEDNIIRTLNSVSWVDKILVIDSGSTDSTLKLLKQFSNVEIVYRHFDSFAEQCNYGLTLIATPWVLSIDADYVFPAESEDLIRKVIQDQEIDAYSIRFDYAVYGKVVKGSILPPRVMLYRKVKAYYKNDGHGHRVQIDGRIKALNMKVIHDDRKPLSRWLSSQIGYVSKESKKLHETNFFSLSYADKIRKFIVFAPGMVFMLVYIIRGGFLSGKAGLYYALQRLIAEILLSLALLDLKVRPKKDDATG